MSYETSNLALRPVLWKLSCTKEGRCDQQGSVALIDLKSEKEEELEK